MTADISKCLVGVLALPGWMVAVKLMAEDWTRVESATYSYSEWEKAKEAVRDYQTRGARLTGTARMLLGEK